MSSTGSPGTRNPTPEDELGVELAGEQLNMILDLREIRIERGLSVGDVAEMMGVDASQVSRFESGGTNPTMSTVRRYARAVGAILRISTRRWDGERGGAAEDSGLPSQGPVAQSAGKAPSSRLAMWGIKLANEAYQHPVPSEPKQYFYGKTQVKA